MDIGVGQEAAMLVDGLTLDHGCIAWLYLIKDEGACKQSSLRVWLQF